MPTEVENKANELILAAMDGRSNKWAKEKLKEKGIDLNDAQISQRLNGVTNWTGNEVVALFEIFNIINQQEILGTGI